MTPARQPAFVALLALLVVLAINAARPAAAQQTGFTGECQDTGAPVRKEAYCKFFKHFAKSATPLDARIADNLGVTRSDQTRSIALVIAIGRYPNHPGYDLPAAEVDADNLEQFLVRDQRFDEVIVLRDADATASTIDYFLGDYLPNRASADFPGKARILIAYSGHGRPDQGAQRAAFLLGAVQDVNGTDDVYPMDTFGQSVQRLAGTSFHVLTLINACFGGSFFTAAMPGGDADKMTLPGSYAITAGPREEEVPALDVARGSLFFDLIIDGVRRGVADPQYWDFYLRDAGGAPIKQQGITRLGALNSYLTAAYDYIDRGKTGDPAFRPLVSPWFGPAQPGVARGGFFLLSAAQAGSPTDLTAAYARGNTQPLSFSLPPPARPDLAIPAGPVSSIAGHPDIKLFKPPEVYPIKGYDLSSADGKIDWPRLVAGQRPRFLYARLLGWRGADPAFQDRWSHAKDLAIDRGVYVKYDFCKSPDAQLSAMKALLRPEAGMLPIAVELVTPSADQDHDQGVHQVPCYTALGPAKARAGIRTFARGLQTAYGSTPLLFGNRYNLSVLTDDQSDEDMIWLAAYSPNSAGLTGRNPWTMWQYSGALTVPGIGPNVTGSVFFGTEDQYAAFKTGRGNVALQAVESK